MPGGLMQIISYGSQDLFLTGTPEITFFKVVYRRHTNFSMENYKFDFDDPVGFGLVVAQDWGSEYASDVGRDRHGRRLSTNNKNDNNTCRPPENSLVSLYMQSQISRIRIEVT